MAGFDPIKALEQRAESSVGRNRTRGGYFARKPLCDWLKSCVEGKLARRRDPRLGPEPTWQDIHNVLEEGAVEHGITEKIPTRKAMTNYIERAHPAEYKELVNGRS